MEIVDKVHIKLTRTDVEKILIDHFKTHHKVELKTISFEVGSEPDDNDRYTSSYAFIGAKADGSRII